MGLLNYEIIKNKAMTFIGMQLFVSCITIPLLAWWGLPISLLSPLGNVIFAPFLTAFLFCSTLLFFATLVNIPCYYLYQVIEYITYFWRLCLSWEPPLPFVTCVRPPLWISIGMPFLAFFIIQNRDYSMFYRNMGLSTLLMSYYGTLFFFYTPVILINSVSHQGNEVHLIKHKGVVTVVDPGTLGKKLSSVSWAEYTLAAEIIKQTGRSIVDHWVMLRPGKIAFDAVVQACYKIKIRNIYIPWWNGRISSSAFRSYKILEKTIEKQNGHMHRIFKVKKSIGNTPLMVVSEPKIRKYHEAHFPQLKLHGIIDNRMISIYAP